MEKKLRCIAVDDEPPALQKMKEYISKIPYFELCGLFDNGMDVIDFLRDNTVDLIFLDIEMKDLNGIQLLNVLQEKPKVILTTAYDDYALKAFELEVCDYLLKPISFERFVKASEKAFKETVKHTHIVEPEKEPETIREFMFVKTEFRMQRINFDDILYIEGLKEYLVIYTASEKVLTLQSFNSIMEVLPENNFIRIHKSYIVAINKIESIERNRISIDKKLLPIGRTYKDEFYTRLKDRNLMA